MPPSRGRAHTRFVGLRPFAFLLSRGSGNYLVMKDHPEVSSLSGRGTASYPAHYRPAFAYSGISYPHRQQHSLRSACPWRGSDTGLPCSTCLTRWVRPQLFPGSHHVRVPPMWKEATDCAPFLVKACQYLWPFQINGVYSLVHICWSYHQA